MSELASQALSLSAELEQLVDALAARSTPGLRAAVAAQLQRLRDQKIDVEALKRGELAPEFDLPDVFSGRRISLACLLQAGPLVLSFVRGTWCPYCNLTLRALNRAYPQLQEKGASLAAITVEPVDSAREATHEPFRFPLLHDPDAKVSSLFGLTFELSEELSQFYRSAGIPTGEDSRGRIVLPVPASYVINRDGIVVYSFTDVDYRRRAEPDALVAAVSALAQQP